VRDVKKKLEGGMENDFFGVNSGCRGRGGAGGVHRDKPDRVRRSKREEVEKSTFRSQSISRRKGSDSRRSKDVKSVVPSLSVTEGS